MWERARKRGWVWWRFRFSHGRVCSGGPHRLDERLHPEDGDHPLQIVGENVKAHLRADLFEGAQPEMGRAHPRLDGSKRMFRGLASGAHGPGRAFQPLLHRVEDGFVLPTLDAPFLCRRALRFQRAGDAFRRPVVMQLSPCLDVRISPGQLLAGRTTVDVFARVVDEILLAEPAVRLGA